GQIESIEAHVVHENDRFSCHYGLEPKLDHEPCWSGDPGQVKAVYAVAKLKDGGKQIEVMTKTQIDSIMGGSQSKGKWGPWKNRRPRASASTRPIRHGRSSRCPASTSSRPGRRSSARSSRDARPSSYARTTARSTRAMCWCSASTSRWLAPSPAPACAPASPT